MRGLKQILMTALLLASAGLAQAQSEPRTALIIGNANYKDSPLANPGNDARDMAEALRNAGFEVILKADANQQAMRDGIRQFGDALKNKGGAGLFFFAGHGVQSGGENYLVPVGEAIGGERDLKAKGVTAAEAVDVMAAARNALNVVILDACRNNPLADSPNATKGLSRIDSNSSLFVSYSTSPGAVALDGRGRNSPYTKHLAQAVTTPNLSLEETFKRTLKGVYQETKGQQTPWISSSFFGDFTFKPGGGAQPQQASLQTAPRPLGTQITAPNLAGIYVVEGKNPNGSRYRGMLTLTPSSKEYLFRWWIGKQIFSGNGAFAGKMLVVEWGDKSPVVYTFGQQANLDGEWADGSATEKLVLYAKAAEGQVNPPQGRYRVNGKNPNGSRYTGQLTISNQGDRYALDWRVGSTAYKGTGTMTNNILTVNWGSATPVIYALSADGTLKGLWDAGKGEEIATPQ
jgi:hypothetical protein